METFHKITWQEFEKIKQTLSSYNEMNLQVSEEQKNQLLQILQKCQNKQKIQKIQINELEQNEMIRIISIIDLWPTISTEQINLDEYKTLTIKLQKSYYKEYNTKALHS